MFHIEIFMKLLPILQSKPTLANGYKGYFLHDSCTFFAMYSVAVV